MKAPATRLLLGCVLSAVCLQCVPTPATAQEPTMHEERGSVLFGAFVAGPDTSAQLDSARGRGTEIDLEGDLGLDTTKTVARLDGYFWFSSRHRVDFSVFEYNRDATKRFERTIEFGDRTFLFDRTIDASADVSVVKTAYTFAPIVRERGYFGITAGLYTASVDLGLAERAAGVEESEGFTAPLPVVGLRGQYGITERIALRGSVEVFRLDAGDAEGRLTDANVGADYSFNDRFALGLAYNYVAVGIDMDEGGDGFQGEIDWGYDGFLLYFKVDFGY